jgi:multimeric flavodoxin WrbA
LVVNIAIRSGRDVEKPQVEGDIVKITVLSGSPKGEISVTLQYVKYIQKTHPDCKLEVFHIGREIKSIEKKPELFTRIIEEVADSDGVMWCTPVYLLLIPSQLKRFIELLSDRGMEDAFRDKYATAITSSAHFYDHTAHNYLQAVSEDLGMRYVDGYSAEFNDLLRPDERVQIENFADRFIRYIEKKEPTARAFMSVSRKMPVYDPGAVIDVPKTSHRRILLVTDASESEVNLRRMTDVFVKSIPCEVEIFNLNEMNLRGGCLGCLGCVYDGVCVYKDDMRDFFLNKLLQAEAVVYAGSVKDRYLSARWKMLFDRMFFNGHRPVFGDQQTGFIISGPLKQIPNLRQVLDAYTGIPRMNNIGIVTDEDPDSEQTTLLLKALGDQILWGIEAGFSRPPSFLGVGGHKVFRDLIYSMRGVMKADHAYYKENGLYDFPQKDLKSLALNLLFLSMRSIPSLRSRMYKEGNKRMIGPLEKVLKQ